MAAAADDGNGNGAGADDVAFGAHADDAEIKAIDDGVIGADTRADYNRKMTAMEAYFTDKKPSVMFPAAHEFGGRVNVERMSHLDFKRFLLSDKKNKSGTPERKAYGVLTKYRAALHYYYSDQNKVLKGTHFYTEICKFLRSISAKDATKRASGVIVCKQREPCRKKRTCASAATC